VPSPALITTTNALDEAMRQPGQFFFWIGDVNFAEAYYEDHLDQTDLLRWLRGDISLSKIHFQDLAQLPWQCLMALVCAGNTTIDIPAVSTIRQ
jgi:hypothetical protein